MSGDPRYSTRAWQRTRAVRLAAAQRTGELCGLCGHAIQYHLRGTHPTGPTVDHITPVIQGGNFWAWTNLQPAHRKCQCSQGAHLTNSKRTASTTPSRTSRTW